MEKQQVCLEEDQWLSKRSSFTSTRCGRSIVLPKRYSSGDFELMKENTQAQKDKRKLKRIQFEIGMLPPKYPKRVEHSLNRASDYGKSDLYRNARVGEPRGAESLMFDRISYESLFQISAIMQSGELQGFLEQIKNQTANKKAEEYLAVDMPTYHTGTFKPGLPSNDHEELFKEDQTTGKKVLIVGRRNGMHLCSILCQGRGGKIPTLECIHCLCLVHAECVGVEFSGLLSYSDFICQICLSLILLRENAKITVNQPLIAPVSPPASRKVAHLLKSTSVNWLNERRKLIKKPHIRKLIPLKVLPIPKPSWNIRSPPTVMLRGGSGIVGRTKMPVIPIPQLKSFRRLVKNAPRHNDKELIENCLSNEAVSRVNSLLFSSHMKQTQIAPKLPPASKSVAPFKIPIGRASPVLKARTYSILKDLSNRSDITLTKVPFLPKHRVSTSMNRNSPLHW